MKQITRTIWMLFVAIIATSMTPPKKKTGGFEGIIEYKIEYPGIRGEGLDLQEMPSKMSFSVKKSKTNLSIEMMGGSFSVVSDFEKKTIFTLMSLMGEKICMSTDSASISQLMVPKFRVVPSSDTKKIAGIRCSKVVLFPLDGAGDAAGVEVFYAPHLVDGDVNWSSGYSGVGGLMMEYTTENQGVEMKITAGKVTKKKLDGSLFEVPASYRVVSQEEVMNNFMNLGE